MNQSRLLLISLTLLCLSLNPACAQGGSEAPREGATETGTTSDTRDLPVTETGPVRITTITSSLHHPWGITFLPDGRALVTERDRGQLRFVSLDGTLSEPIPGVPEVDPAGQGGLLDVALDPDFDSNRLVYLSYAARGENGASTSALGRGRLENDRLEGFERIFVEEPWIDDSKHFGGRIVFDGKGHLFFTLGDRYQFEPAQDLSNHLGTVVRLLPDGSIPKDNPFAGKDGAASGIWSYGHRNIEAAAVHPETGRLWVAEMGPRGGDELNLPEAGKNYGWPLVSWGNHYNGQRIPDPPTRPDLTDAVKNWTPVISPSGMEIYTGDAFPEWRHNIFIGSLSDASLVRLRVEGDKVAEESRIPLGARIRDVAQGPDGLLYVLTDQRDGKLLQLAPRTEATP